jgi:M6 family metalloprotease-like protein
MLAMSIMLTSMTPAHPQKSDIPYWVLDEDISDDFILHRSQKSKSQKVRAEELVNNILVLRVEFADVKFNIRDDVWPWYHPQNEEYFDKYMQHLRNFYLDASGEMYNLNYTIAPNVYTTSQNMGWYGDDNFESRRRVLLVEELINLAVADGVDFSNYEGYIVFRAGAGQESDINDSQTHTLWSTFMSRNTFRNVLDPGNDDYQGIPAGEGNFVSRVAFLPAQQIHPDFPQNDGYHFEILGTLVHQFGRVMGLPTLFGNVAAFGSTAGTGNFCVMGTGIWNNNGKIPPLPSAWVRYFAGWVEPVVVQGSSVDLEITYPQSESGEPTVYKLEISEREYFLIENRQMDFVKDYVMVNNRPFPLHTFELLPDSEQDYYYGIDPATGNEVRVPMVNLIKNNLRGSEWDYFMPNANAINGSYQDGSGLFIWHIDENVIVRNLASNTINANPMHRGVSLKEADGVQHLGSTLPHPYMRGGPFDSYRAVILGVTGSGVVEYGIGHKDYLGKLINPATGLYSFPTAESYYGGIPIEIYDISENGNLMTFSTRFESFSQADFPHENYIEAFVFPSGEINQVFYFHADGYLSIFEDHQFVKLFSIDADTLMFNYTFDGVDTIVIPAQKIDTETVAKLIYYEGSGMTEVWSMEDWVWAGSVVYVDDVLNTIGSSENIKWILHLSNGNESKFVFLGADFVELGMHLPEFHAISNISYHHKSITFIAYENDKLSISTVPTLPTYIIPECVGTIPSHPFDTENGRFNLFTGNFFGTGHKDHFVHYTDGTINLFYLFCTPCDSWVHLDISFPYKLTGQPVFKDTNNNGRADVILPHANGFMVYSLAGTLIKSVYIDSPDFSDEVGSGIVAWNWTGNDDTYYMGGFSRNRLKFFDDKFNEIRSMSRTLSRPMRTLPYITTQNDSIYIYQTTDMGRIYNLNIPEITSTRNLTWSLAHGNYFRNSFWSDELIDSFSPSSKVFVSGQNFVYPNPFLSRHHELISFHILTTIDTEVEINIYNISGQRVGRIVDMAEAHTISADRFTFSPNRLSSGVYFAVVRAGGETLQMKFAIER